MSVARNLQAVPHSHLLLYYCSATGQDTGGPAECALPVPKGGRHVCPAAERPGPYCVCLLLASRIGCVHGLALNSLSLSLSPETKWGWARRCRQLRSRPTTKRIGLYSWWPHHRYLTKFTIKSTTNCSGLSHLFIDGCVRVCYRYGFNGQRISRSGYPDFDPTRSR